MSNTGQALNSCLTFSIVFPQAESDQAAAWRPRLRNPGPMEPDILVSDIGMPGEDGYDLIRRVRALESERGGTIPALAGAAYGLRQC